MTMPTTTETVAKTAAEPVTEPATETAAETNGQAEASRQHHYTRNILAQMLAVLLLLLGVIVWQWDVVQQIYLQNQVNAIGWTINGGIVLLFLFGLAVLVWRFFEYRDQEIAIARFLLNTEQGREPLLEVNPKGMLAERYRTLLKLSRRHADINHNALASTLLASESSRNSFPKFVHNVLILTGVFGTIISLSLSLLGASEMIHGSTAANGLGTMIFGMSTALSTTMTAILAYLIFGYFYIKLTDTQTYLISRVEEVTATILLPHLRLNQPAQKNSTDRPGRSASQPVDAMTRVELEAMLTRITETQLRSAEESRALLSEAVQLLREGFRLRK